MTTPGRQTDFAANLRRIRAECDLSQSDLAKLMRVTRQCVNRWELGATRPDLATVAELADVLGVSVDDLVLRPPPERPAPT